MSYLFHRTAVYPKQRTEICRSAYTYLQCAAVVGLVAVLTPEKTNAQFIACGMFFTEKMYHLE